MLFVRKQREMDRSSVNFCDCNDGRFLGHPRKEARQIFRPAASGAQETKHGDLCNET